jgi:hypothetical protein
VRGVDLGDPEGPEIRAVSPDGRTLAVARHGQSSARFVDLESGEESTLPLGVLPARLAFSQAARSLVLLSTFDTISLVPRDGGPPTVLPGRYRTFAVSAVAGRIAAVTLDQIVRVYDPLGRAKSLEQRLLVDAEAIAFSPDESSIGVQDPESRVVAIDLQTGKEASRAQGPGPSGSALFAIGPQGKLIAVGARWGILQLWCDSVKLAETDAGREVRALSFQGDRLVWARLEETSGRRRLHVDSMDVSTGTLLAARLLGRFPAPGIDQRIA